MKGTKSSDNNEGGSLFHLKSGNTVTLYYLESCWTECVGSTQPWKSLLNAIILPYVELSFLFYIVAGFKWH